MFQAKEMILTETATRIPHAVECEFRSGGKCDCALFWRQIVQTLQERIEDLKKRAVRDDTLEALKDLLEHPEDEARRKAFLSSAARDLADASGWDRFAFLEVGPENEKAPPPR